MVWAQWRKQRKDGDQLWLEALPTRLRFLYFVPGASERPANACTTRHTSPKRGGRKRLTPKATASYVWPKAHPAISRGVCTAQCGFFIYIDVGHEAPPCRALRAPAERFRTNSTLESLRVTSQPTPCTCRCDRT